jgi:hypothetical protein
VTPRRQWNANYGYCGETSFIAVGMRFGQYCSQFTARSLASPGMAESLEESQLLLGVNDVAAARAMRLDAVSFYHPSQRSVAEFSSWVKSNVARGRAVVIGVLNNVRALEEPLPGSKRYDHIVPLLSVGSRWSLAGGRRDRAAASDVMTFSDNGLYGPVGDPPAYPMVYSYRVGRLPRTRAAANRADGPLYALRDRPPSYGVAIGGILDLDGVTIPVRLTSDLDGEPDMPDPSDVPPPPVPMRLTARVTIPDQRVAYRLYRYDDFAKVPAARFNASADRAAQAWNIPPGVEPEFVVDIATTSDATVVLRAVPQSAP